ncbi:hypothetical protein ACEWY4_007069 [Coilia grayii]|uniref:Ig-like domain-containing protein n=1 Tax=Coilia grayii TaxID=363190 RepID=A0ABD1KFL4_9TELE
MCHYKTSYSAPSLFWYKQWANSIPEFVLMTFSNSEGHTEAKFKERFHAKVNSSSKSVPLTIQDLQVSDSAVYYCALQPTVTAAHSTLIQKLHRWMCQGDIVNLNTQMRLSFIMLPWVKILVLLTANCAMVGGEDSVNQTHGDLNAFGGDTVTIACHYETSANTPSLLWYRHQANGFPEFMLITYTYREGDTEEKFKQRFHSKVDATSKSAPLTIKDLQVSDSAVYYCALQPTVIPVHSTLIQKLHGWLF